MTTSNDVISFVAGWRVANGLAPDEVLSAAQKEQFARELQSKVAEMPVLFEHQSQAGMIAYSGTLTKVHVGKKSY